MPYDEQGNFYGSDEDLGALEAKYKKPDLASQIPGQVSSSKSDEPKSLRERAVSALTQANPLMMAKSFQDMTKTLVGGAALPVVAPVSAGVQALNALPGNLLRRSRGEEEIKTPSANDLMRKYGEAIAPQTPAGQNFQEGLGKLMETLKVPHAWPVTPNVPRRPLVTPTDVRVGAGQVKQLAKELRETPADFQAAQSGLKRQNLYGEDTLGVKAQAAADALGDTLERRKSAGLSTIPGVPQALTPETKLYAVRPKGTRMVQPKVPKSAGLYRPDVSPLEGIVEDVYGDTPAAKMPPEMVSAEYAKRFLTPDSELSGAFKNYMTLRVQEMFPDAPTPRAAQNAYDLLYADRSERTKQQMVELEEFLTNVVPEYRESAPTPTEFMQRMAEAERVVKGPFSTYLSKNVGAEGDPTVKLARQGITFESPEEILELAKFADSPSLAAKRLEAGFPIMGTYADEHFQKGAEFDALTQEIGALEDARRPLFDRAHAEGIDPASIPEYAETTNPLRQKLRQREQLQGEIENIKLARAVEDISDSAVETKTKQEMLERIPFEQRQFYPGVTKAGEGEKLYVGRESILKDFGFKKLGKELVEDILTGKAGDTSKLTIENYMREKGLSRLEAEKAAKLQQQQYRETLQTTLLDRIKNDQNVKMIGNAAIITLDANTPRDVAMRDMSADTAVLDHCVGQCGTAPQGRKNVLSGKQQYYEPVIDPITGERNARGTSDTSYVKQLEYGHELVSVRDARTGLPAATLELIPSSETGSSGKFRIGYASGAKNGAIDPAYTPALRDYLNSRAADIYSPGSNLSDNAGIFDSTSPAEFKRVAREAGLTNDQVKAVDWGDLPRFVTVDDVKEMAKGIKSVASRELAVRDEGPIATLTPRDYEVMVDDFNAAMQNAVEGALENSQLDNPNRTESALNNVITGIFDNHLNDPAAFSEEGVARLLRTERDIEAAIQRSYAQRTNVDHEVAGALEDFLIDVRGIRGNIERRVAAAERQQAQTPAVTQRAPALREEPIPIMSPTDLLEQYGDRLTNEQQNWLRNHQREFIAADATPGRQTELAGEYANWRDENRLQAQRAPQGDPMPDNLDVMDLVRAHGDRMTPEQIAWLEDFSRRWDEDVDMTPAGQAIESEMVAEYDRWLASNRLQPDPLANLFDDLEPDPTAVANQGAGLTLAGQDVYELAARYDVPPGMIRNILVEANGPVDRVLELQNEAFTGVGRFETLPEAGRTGATQLIRDLLIERGQQIRNERQQAAPAQPGMQLAQAAPIPRHIQTLGIQELVRDLSPAWNRQAQELADTYFNDNIIDDNNVTISSLTNMLRNYRVGPHAEAPNEVRELAARRLESLNTGAQQDADQIGETLREAFYDDMDGPAEAMEQIERDIRTLERRGEEVWEDLLGPLAEDIPYSRNLQYRVLENLRIILDQFREIRDRLGDDFAKGGLVKKKRKAKKPTMALVVTKKNPGLAEMAYRYGGMVR